MQRLKPLLISTIFLFLVCACGQKGPLFLPGSETPEAANAEYPATEQTKEDEAEEDEVEEDDGKADETNP
jgi:predicted small lipoprotein YifL